MSHRKTDKLLIIWSILIFSIVFCGVIAILCYSAEASNYVVINEVCSKNFSVIHDENGAYSDYIELYNPAIVPVSLTGFSLSDDKHDLRKCLLDTMSIPAKGHLLVWADDSNGKLVGHASFKLTSKGEQIYLINKYGRIIDSVEMPNLEYNTVYARIDDGDERWAIRTPTCNENNSYADTILPTELPSPIFSVESGFYETSFKLEITSNDESVIYYTLDGSEPTTKAMIYKDPIIVVDASHNENIYAARTDLQATMEYVPNFKVDKGTVVRAMAFSPNSGSVSEIVTAIYFVGFNQKKEYENYAVMSLVTDPDNLFDQENGIYGNGEALENYIAQAGLQDGVIPDSYTDENGSIHYKYSSTNAYERGKEWERETELVYFDQAHNKKFEQTVGIRISGESSRNAAQKSFNLYARDIYDGNDTIKYDFFEGMKYSTIKLRNGGTVYAGSKIHDAFLQSLAQGTDVSIQDSKPCIVFLNGEYWGIYNIRERYKEDYFQNHYGINGNNVWMIDSGASSLGGWDAWNDYDAMLQFISENDMKIAENYKKACELIDIQSLIDFYCIQLYVDNDDVGFDKNIALWRSKEKGDGEYEDGRWRFMLYDLDGGVNTPENNTFIVSEWWKENFSLMDEGIMKSLLRNPEFKKKFTDSFEEIASNNFNYDYVHKRLMEWQQQYQVQVVKSHQRFISKDIEAEDYMKYISHIDNFFKVRYNYIIDYLYEKMETCE